MNAVSLIGRLVRDPDIRYGGADNQTAIARFAIAIDRMPDKSGEKKTDFPSIVCFGKTAELVEKYMRKGRLVGINGRIQTGSYEDKDGKKVYTTEVVADRVEFLDKANSEAAPQQEAIKPASDDIPSGFSQLTDEDIPF